MKLILLLFLIGAISWTSAQTKTYQYTYDDSGNRTERNVVYLRTAGGGGNVVFTPEGREMGAVPNPDAVLATAGKIQVSLFPNPTSSVVNVVYPDDTVTTEEARIVNGDGKLMYREENLRGNFSLPFGQMPAGRYFIWLKLHGKVERFPVIKE